MNDTGRPRLMPLGFETGSTVTEMAFADVVRNEFVVEPYKAGVTSDGRIVKVEIGDPTDVLFWDILVVISNR